MFRRCVVVILGIQRDAFRLDNSPERRCFVRLISAVVIVGAFVIWQSVSRGATLYWDTNEGVPGCGLGNGDWFASNWSADVAGSITTGVWTNGSDAVLSAGSDATGNLTISANSTEILIGNLTVEEGNILIVGSSAFNYASKQTWTTNAGGSLYLDNDIASNNGASLTIKSDGNTTLNGTLNSSGMVNKTGTGVLFLNGVTNLTTSNGNLSVSAGTVSIQNGSIQANGLSITGSGSKVILSGASLNLTKGFSVDGGSGTPCAFQMTGGTLNCGGSLSVGSGYTTASTLQSGGTATMDTLRVGISSVGTYNLSGTAVLYSRESLVGGNQGIGSFVQSGGAHIVSADLTVGYRSTLSGRDGYYQLDAGTLSTGATFLGSWYGDGNFQQNGGEFAAGFLGVKSPCSYTMRGGQLSAMDSMYVGGTLDLGGTNAASVSVGGIANLCGATIIGGQQATFSVAPDSLVIFPADFNPNTRFASFSNKGLVSNLGSGVNIPVGRVVKGSGTIVDHVYCAGSLLQQAGYTVPTLALISNNSINLKTGIMVDGGTARLGPAATVTVNDSISGIAGGELQSQYMNVGYGDSGSFNQTGGSVSASSLTIGISTGNSRVSGTYTISGGSLAVDSGLTLGATQGNGTMQQIGGQVRVGSALTIGTGGHAGPPLAIYEICGGSLSAAGITVGGTYAFGTFEVLGSDAIIVDTGSFSLAPNNGGGFGQLFSHVEEDGLSTIVVSGKATLAGSWELFDDGAPCGRWNVLTAEGGVTSPGTVRLPDATWSWGIDAGTTLWVQHVPEPSALALLGASAFGLLGVVLRRRVVRCA